MRQDRISFRVYVFICIVDTVLDLVLLKLMQDFTEILQKFDRVGFHCIVCKYGYIFSKGPAKSTL